MTEQMQALEWLSHQRVARLATADTALAPHVVPVCFALAERQSSLYITIDEKPKQTDRPLKRIRNILENPQVALIADRWEEDWSQLAWVMVRGVADLLQNGEEHGEAQALLRGKYQQYRAMALEPLPVIAVRIKRLTWWGRLDG
jgi:coenzyme F420-0:L-glutamate ligase/coenzyme F420-1:gamma-L-glutamate ligase